MARGQRWGLPCFMFHRRAFSLAVTSEGWRCWNFFGSSWTHVTNGWWWLVAMNLAFSHSYWECHHPNWRTHIFQRGGEKPPTSYKSKHVKIWKNSVLPEITEKHQDKKPTKSHNRFATSSSTTLSGTWTLPGPYSISELPFASKVRCDCFFVCDSLHQRKSSRKPWPSVFFLVHIIWLVVWLPFSAFSHILGISSSQLTNSYFSEGWPKTTNQSWNCPWNQHEAPSHFSPSKTPVSSPVGAFCPP